MHKSPQLKNKKLRKEQVSIPSFFENVCLYFRTLF